MWKGDKYKGNLKDLRKIETNTLKRRKFFIAGGNTRIWNAGTKHNGANKSDYECKDEDNCGMPRSDYNAPYIYTGNSTARIKEI